MLAEGYIVMALIKAKEELFHERFITMAELTKFQHFMQQEFNNRNLGIAITVGGLSRNDFLMINGVIVATDMCSFFLDRLPINVYEVLTDKSLMVSFLMNLELEKIQSLENVQEPSRLGR